MLTALVYVTPSRATRIADAFMLPIVFFLAMGLWRKERQLAERSKRVYGTLPKINRRFNWSVDVTID